MQGLRGVAVVLVVAYHAGVLPGGFVGVDVFFVISGMMITQQILRPSGRGVVADVGTFYARRAKRILPASLLTIVGTVVAGYFVLDLLDWRELVTDGVWSSAFAMNVRLAHTEFDYLRSSLPPSALQHFWSLGVEEQFYFMWPMLAFAAIAIGRRWVLPIAAVALAVSFAVMMQSAELDPWRFYSPWTRGWQLLVGALLAIRPPSPLSLLKSGRHVWSVAGATAVGIGVWLADRGVVWPGSVTVVLTCGTAMILAGPQDGIVNVGLARGWLTWIGDRSYSWYLLHFPPLIFLEIALGSGVPVALGLSVSAVTLVAANWMYAMFETPIRRTRLPTTASLLAAAGAVCVMVFVGLGIRSNISATGSGEVAADPSQALAQDDRTRDELLNSAARVELVPSNLEPSLLEARDDQPSVYDSGCHGGLDDVTAEPCVVIDGDGPTVVVLGDSHAAQWIPTFERVAIEESWRLVALTKSACTPAALETFNPTLDRWYAECVEWHESAREAIRGLDADLVLVGGSSEYPFIGPTAERYTREMWQGALAEALKALDSVAGTVVLIEDTTYPPSDVPSCLTENMTSASTCAFVGTSRTLAYADAERGATAQAGVELLRTRDLLCGTERCPPIVGNLLVYRDGSHMTTRFAESLAGPVSERLHAIDSLAEE